MSRPLRPHPQTALCAGSDDIHDVANWVCGGNADTKKTVCPNVLVKYKNEVDGPLDFAQAGVDPDFCEPAHEADSD